MKKLELNDLPKLGCLLIFVGLFVVPVMAFGCIACLAFLDSVP